MIHINGLCIVAATLLLAAACGGAVSSPDGTTEGAPQGSGSGASGAQPNASADEARSLPLPPAQADGGECAPGTTPYWYAAGCDGAVAPLCTDDGSRHACEAWHCGCDGVSFFTHCNQTERPYRAFGKCSSPDAGPAHDGGE